MSGILGGAPVTPEVQEGNNRHRHGWVLAVLGVLCVYLYCFTHVDRMLGVTGTAGPGGEDGDPGRPCLRYRPERGQ